MNMSHRMFSHNKLLFKYQDEFIACLVYLLNRSPMLSVQDKIIEETWSGTKTSVSHLRVFCFVSFSHVPNELRRNMDKKSERCIFIGYSEKHKDYKLYIHVTKNIVVRRDVNFLE